MNSPSAGRETGGTGSAGSGMRVTLTGTGAGEGGAMSAILFLPVWCVLGARFDRSEDSGDTRVCFRPSGPGSVHTGRVVC